LTILYLLPFGAGMLGRYEQEPVALRIYGLLLVAIVVMRVVIWLYTTNRPRLLIYAAMPVLYFLTITVLRSGRERDQEYADFT
jgi:hypothetical protein